MRKTRLTNTQNSRTGFTIVELMIATTVFSMILILSLTGFLQIGQLFYKGVNITSTTNTAKQVIGSLKSDVSFDSDTASITILNDPLTSPAQDRFYFCAGSNRYSFILGKQVDREAAANEIKTFPVSGWYRFGLLKDQVSTSLNCPPPFSSSDPLNGQIDPANVTELIGDKMRLSNLTIQSVSNTLYTLSVHIAYGDDDVLDDPGGEAAKCKPGAANSRYCFATDVRTTVRRGFLP